MAKVILDLCSGSGNWSAPYAENGYEVIRVDLPTDVRLIHKSKTPEGFARAFFAANP